MSDINVTEPTGFQTVVTTGDAEHITRAWMAGAVSLVPGKNHIEVFPPALYHLNDSPNDGMLAVRANYRKSNVSDAMQTEWFPLTEGEQNIFSFRIEGLQSGTSYDVSVQGKLT